MSRGTLELPTLAALIFAHSRCDPIDHAEIASLKEDMRREERAADENSFLLLAHFHRFTNPDNLAEARKAAKHALKKNASSERAMTLQAHLELLRTKKRTPEVLQDVARLLQPGLKRQSLDALLGLTQYFLAQNQRRKAVEAINQTIVRYKWFAPALMTKANLLLSIKDWSQAEAVARQSMETDPENVEALQILVLCLLFRNGDVREIDSAIGDLSQSMGKKEKRNAKLHRDVSATLARLAGRNKKLLGHTLALVERAADIDPKNATFLCECAFQHTLRGDLAAGVRMYRQAATLDESNADAIQGTIRCKLLQGKLQEAGEQLEFYNAVVVDTMGKSPAIAYLNAQLAIRKDGHSARNLELLDEVLQLHWEGLESCEEPRNSFAWIERLNVDTLLQIAKEFLACCPDEPLKTTDVTPPALKRAMALLTRISRLTPGSISAKFLLAKCNFLVGTDDSFRIAETLLSETLNLDAALSQSSILSARIALRRDRHDAASKSLDDALSRDFGVRKDPHFNLIKARVLESTDNFEDAKKVLEDTLKLPIFDVDGTDRPSSSASAASRRPRHHRRGSRTSSSSKTAGDDASAPLASRLPSETLSVLAKIYERLAGVCHALKQSEEASTYIKTALSVFQGTPHETRLRIVESRHAVERGEVKRALRLLAKMIRKGKEDQTDTSEGWIQATIVKADIYLLHRRDKKGYKRCFETIASRLKSKRGFVLLGDSYLKIQEPLQAIRAYERALKIEPGDVSLSIMIGDALKTTHNYQGAIDYFERALSNSLVTGGRKMEIRLALAKLNAKLGRWSDAKEVLRAALESRRGEPPSSPESKARGGSSGVNTMADDVQILMINADVHFGSGDDAEAMELLCRARALQTKLLDSLGPNSSGAAPLRKTAADICCKLGGRLVDFDGGKSAKEQNERALELFRNALDHDDTHEDALLNLAKMQLYRGEIEKCEKSCNALLRIDPAHKDASVLLADALSMKTDATPALYHFTQLLKKRPDNFDVLARVISLLWRQGKLKDAKCLLERAKQSSHGALHSAGFHYCQGLYYRYATEPDKAVDFFNKARRDGEWGRRAIEGLVRVYISPGGIGTYLWDLLSLDDESETQEATRVIESVMSEPPMLPHTNRDKVLLCYARLLNQYEPNVNEALKMLVKIIQKNKTFVPALLCMSVALQMIGQAPKARNQLKRICKLRYNRMYAEEFEESYLMLATIYVNSKKYDLALELCKRCLLHNQSCARAWEHMGMIMEMEHSYKDAADYYEKAWYFGQEASAPIGFKLAFNYLKAKRYIEAVDVCHKVLRKFPDYPKIRSEVLDRARQALRH
eukprot:g2504.t1